MATATTAPNRSVSNGVRCAGDPWSNDRANPVRPRVMSWPHTGGDDVAPGLGQAEAGPADIDEYQQGHEGRHGQDRGHEPSHTSRDKVPLLVTAGDVVESTNERGETSRRGVERCQQSRTSVPDVLGSANNSSMESTAWLPMPNRSRTNPVMATLGRRRRRGARTGCRRNRAPRRKPAATE